MAIRSLFNDQASIDVAGIWFVSRTTPILYPQPRPDELYIILGYNLGNPYPNLTPDQSGSEAVDPVDADALAAGTPTRYVTDFAIRAESSPGAEDGMIRLQMGDASDAAPAGSQPLTANALEQGVLAIQARPSNAVYTINLADFVSGGAFAWLDPPSMRIGAEVWSVVTASTEIRTVIFDSADAGIDGANHLYDDESAQPAPVDLSDSELASIFPGPPAPAAETAAALWIDIVTAGVRYGPLRDIASWEQQEIWNEGSRFSFTAVKKEAALQVDSLSEVYAYSLVGGHVTLVGAGLILDIEETPGETETTISVTGVGFEHELLMQPPVALAFADTSHDIVVNALAALLPSEWSLEADPAIRGKRLTSRITGKSLLDAIRKCAEFFGTTLQFGFGRIIRMRTYYTPLAIVASEDGGLGARIVKFKRKPKANRSQPFCIRALRTGKTGCRTRLTTPLTT